MEQHETIISKGLLELEVERIVKQELTAFKPAFDVQKDVDNAVTAATSAIRIGLSNLADDFQKLKKAQPSVEQLEINIVRPRPNGELDAELVKLDAQHKQFKTLLDFLAANIDTYIYGPTGAGKTKAVFIIAKKVLKIPIQSITVGPHTADSKIFGYNDAHGRYVPGAAFEVYRNGGILCVNEMDNGNPAVNTALNQLSDEECYFPNGVQKRHENFFVIATANTIGNGANSRYIGRSAQDKALLNRFAYLEWGYDLELERRLAWAEFQRFGGTDQKLFEKGLSDFWNIREAVDELKIDHLLSSRNLICQQSRMLARGIDKLVIARSVFNRGVALDVWRKITNKANEIEATKAGLPFTPNSENNNNGGNCPI